MRALTVLLCRVFGHSTYTEDWFYADGRMHWYRRCARCGVDMDAE